MIASQTADQDIEQAIQRLQKKMPRMCLTALIKAADKRSADPKKIKQNRNHQPEDGALKSLLKYLFILLLIGATSFILAQIATGYLDSRTELALTSADSGQGAEQNQPMPVQRPTRVRIPASPAPAPAPAAEPAPAPANLAAGLADGIGQGISALPAKFSMQAANYDVIDSDLGPVLDIAITVANIGGAAGRPEMFEIELVDEANKQLMKWPMVVSGTAILPQQQMVYKTRLIEPPANFKNIRVTMKK